MFAQILRFKKTGKRMIQEDDVLPRATEPPFLISHVKLQINAGISRQN